MKTLPRNTRSVATSCAMSSGKYDDTASKEHVPSTSRRYVAVPHVVLEVEMRPADRAVLVALFTFLPYSWDTLLSGRRLTCSRRSDEIASRAGISVRSLTASVRRLTEFGLIRVRTCGRRPSLWEVMPAAFGLVDDDIERRRLSVSTKRRYVALPFSVVGAVSPSELAVLVEILAVCGSRPFSRLEAGEQLIATFHDSDLCSRTGMTVRTARRAFQALKGRGLVDGDVRRGHWIVEACAGMFGIERRSEVAADLPIDEAEADKSAEQTGSLLIHVHEGVRDRRGTRARAASIYPGLLSIAYGGTPTVTTPSLRGRVAQSALRLALAGAVEAEVEREGWRLARETASPPRPEAVVDAVLAVHASSALRTGREAQFTSVSRPAGSLPSPAWPTIDESLLVDFDDLELATMKWRTRLEDGDPAVESFRELLGGQLPWESGYVLRARRLSCGGA